MIRARCVCGCGWDAHQHHRRGEDCGEHGRWVCPRYVPLDRRDKAALTPSQRVALAESDAHMWRNLAALGPFASSTRPRALPVPRQRGSLIRRLDLPALTEAHRDRLRKARR
ncbi:hypothetical protein EV383_4364 [Pseudonocardia sediminis]|uniref:Uncharacterized protein n=1 Tax=Pseudonocardia sediminis TaxID=1397368 RepID=A0A4V2FR68_PSEST|nr:hypothetical protein EV383_4364 [Pseudonocardia sediminis]